MAGLVTYPRPDAHADDKPLVAATMFGVTTACVERARETLEQAGCEVLVFHATGNGGQAMESLIREGLIAGVLDLTTTELADEHVGGFLSAGPDRLTAAGDAGIPRWFPQGRSTWQTSTRRTRPREVQRSSFLPTQRERHADADHAGRERAHRRRIAHKLQRRRDPSPSCSPARRVRDRQRGTTVRRSGGAQGAPRRIRTAPRD